MKSLASYFCGIIITCLLGSSLMAQSTTGGLRGRLVDESGAPIEAANIILTNLSSNAKFGAVTDANGSFVFYNLPIGEFDLNADHLSFISVRIQGVVVHLGAVTNLGTINMSVQEQTIDGITITSARLPFTSEISHSLQKAVLDYLPVDRDYKNAITLLPQINTSYFGDGININGATGAENMFYLNGVNVTDNFSSSWTPTFNNSSFLPYNFIKEVKVKQSSYSAEFGRAVGGIVDVVTQSGGNEFSGQAFGYFSGSFLNSSPTGGVTGAQVGKTSNYDAGFSFGGPIVRDKAWYYAAYSYYYNQVETNIGHHGYFPNETISNLLALKFDWQASKKTFLDLTFVADPTISKPVLSIDATGSFVPDSIANPDAMWAKTSNGGLNVVLTGTTRASSKTIFKYAITGYQRRSEFGGATSLGNQTQIFEATTGTVSGGVGFIEDMSTTRQSARVSMSHGLNRHTLLAGIESELNFLSGESSVPAPGNVLSYGPEFFILINSTQKSNLGSLYHAAFYQHDWQILPRILIEMGLRWEVQQLRDNWETILETFNNQWQPRFGVNWVLDDEETKKLSANYGRVYQSLPLNFSLFYAPSFGGSGISYNAFPYEQESVPADTLWNIIPYTTPTYPYNTSSYQSNFADQYSIRFSQAIGDRMTFTSSLIHKSLGTAFLVGVVDSLYSLHSGNPGKGEMAFLPEARQNYTAAEFGVTGSSASNKLKYGLYYTWARNYGNYIGFWSQELKFYSPSGGNTINAQTTTERQSNTIGLLPNDRTHIFKANASYNPMSSLSIGTSVVFSSGTPLSEYIPNTTQPFNYDLLTKRGSAGRLPMLWDMNIRVGYVTDMLPLRVSVDIFHVGNPQRLVDQVQLKYLDPEGTQINPTFGKPLRYQQPMAVRFGVEYQF